MRNAVLWLLASAAAASAAGFDGVWDAVIVANGFRVPFRMELTASPARVCFFEDTQPVCSTSAKTEGGQLIARWDYLNTELRLTPHDGQLTGGYRNVTAPNWHFYWWPSQWPVH